MMTLSLTPDRPHQDPFAALTGMAQVRVAFPSTRTVQAPHAMTPQPNFVPVKPK